MDNFDRNVALLAQSVASLTSSLDKARGGWGLIGVLVSVAGTGGAVLGWFVSHFKP